MRLPLRSADTPDGPTSDARRRPATAARSHRAGRRSRLVAVAAVGALGAAALATYVVLDRPVETVEQAAPIHSTGSTFIDLPDELVAPSTRKARRERAERRPEASPAQVLDDPGGRRLVIPALGVDSAIVPIISAGGTLTPPGDAQQVGWWASGAAPGDEVGSALVTGHTLSSGGAALQDLETLETGDRMSVRTDDGVIDYRVSDVEIFSKGTIAVEAGDLFSQTAPGRLVVITCEDYNGSTYLSNVVVTATPVGTPSVDF